jgi:hypothetical protein
MKKIDTDKRVVILIPFCKNSVGNFWNNMLWSWGLISNRAELIDRTYILRTCSRAIVLVEIDAFRCDDQQWKNWMKFKTMLQEYRIKFIELKRERSSDQFIKMFDYVYGEIIINETNDNSSTTRSSDKDL